MVGRSGRSASSEDSVPFFLESECPDSLYDSDFCGNDEDARNVCFHRQQLIRMVAFEGTDTGRKFLGCGVEGDNCGYVRFEDREWPATLKKALLKVWFMFEQCKLEKEATEELLRKALEEKEKAVDARMQIELQTADLLSEYKEKADAAKNKLKKVRKHSMQNDNVVLYALCAIVFLLGVLLGVWSSK